MQNQFFSCVESRIQDHGEIYARFHVGSFVRGQALTMANALRRTLVSEIPGLVMTNIQIEGAAHEFDRIHGVQEPVLDILLNLKGIVYTPSNRKLDLFRLLPSKAKSQSNSSLKAFLKVRGPAKITARDIKLPPQIAVVDPSHEIATLSSTGELVLSFDFTLRHPKEICDFQKNKTLNNKKYLTLDHVPSPVKKVNYIIRELDAKKGSEYIILEIWTDGSVNPVTALHFGLKQVCKLFYDFTRLSFQLYDPSRKTSFTHPTQNKI